MDVARQSVALPSINFLDIEKINGEKADFCQKYPSSTVINMPAPALVSPSTQYYGPPPPYSYPSSTTTSVAGLNGYISPPGSRRTSDDNKEPQPPPPPLSHPPPPPPPSQIPQVQQSQQPPPPPPPPPHRQSLPSIHEALGNSKPLSYSSAPPQTVSSPRTILPTSVNTPITPIPRSHPEAVLQGPPNPFAQGPPYPYASLDGQDRRSHPAYTSQSSGELPPRFPYLNAQEPASYPAHSKGASNPTSPVRSSPRSAQHPHSSPMYPSIQQPTTSVGSQNVYNTYHPPYSYPPQPPSMLLHQPQYNPLPTWRSDSLEFERAEEIRKVAPKGSPGSSQHYGESVKRHLESFELETSLNEIAEGSGRALKFSRHYSASAFQTQRSGPLPNSLPTLAECEEMMRHQHRVLDSMVRIRDVIINQQHALAEQRTRDEANKEPSDYGDDGIAGQDKSEGGGGFAGADPKKRRGRNAPPGRCHSCNRAETPEWRRGPDGARTLCNACGLHYAKLTRKMGSKTTLGGSHLRPKETDQSP